MARICAEDNMPLKTFGFRDEHQTMILILLSVVSLDCCVVVFLSELHAVDKVAHVLGEHLVRHLDLSVSVGGEGRNETIHSSQQLPQLQANLDTTNIKLIFGMQCQYLPS